MESSKSMIKIEGNLFRYNEKKSDHDLIENDCILNILRLDKYEFRIEVSNS
jgi:hypothetical protein